MGNTTLLDVIGSITTFGLLLLAALRLNASASENNYAYNENYLLQRNMVMLTVMLEQDLNNVGAGANDQYGGVVFADTNVLRFLSDLNQDGIAETVEWRVGLPSELPQTPNPRDRYLYRTVGGVETKMNLGVTDFTFHYWNVVDPTLPVPTPVTQPPSPSSTGNIGPIEVYIRLESGYKMKQDYMSDTTQYEMVWRQMRAISRNCSSQQ